MHDKGADESEQKCEEGQEDALVLIWLSWIHQGKPVELEADSHDDHEGGDADDRAHEVLLDT